MQDDAIYSIAFQLTHNLLLLLSDTSSVNQKGGYEMLTVNTARPSPDAHTDHTHNNNSDSNNHAPIVAPTTRTTSPYLDWRPRILVLVSIDDHRSTTTSTAPVGVGAGAGGMSDNRLSSLLTAHPVPRGYLSSSQGSATSTSDRALPILHPSPHTLTPGMHSHRKLPYVYVYLVYMYD